MSIEAIKIFLKSVLFKGGSVMTAACVLGGALGYVYQILMGRMLSPGEYALFTALMGLFAFFSSPIGALTMAVARHVSTLQVRDQRYAMWKLLRKLNGTIMLIAIVFAPLFYFFIDVLRNYLKTQSLFPVYLFGMILLMSAPLAVVNGFLQGLKCFLFLGGSGTFGVISKIILSVIFLISGYGISGAIFGFFLSIVIAWIFCFGFVAMQIYVSQKDSAKNSSSANTSLSLQGFYPILLANIAFAAMTQLDMVMVNHLFDSQTAGYYAAASVLGKAVLYLPGGVVSALFPIVAERSAKMESSAHLLFQAVFVILLFCTLASLLYFFFSDWIIHIFYGPNYSGASELLRWYGFAVLPIALVMVAEHYLIAKGKVFFAWLFLAFSPLQLFAIILWHQKVWMVLAIVGAFGTLTMFVGYGLLWREYRRAIS